MFEHLNAIIGGLVLILALVLIHVQISTRPKHRVPKTRPGGSAYKYTGPKPAPESVIPTRDHEGNKILKYVPASHMNRHARRAAARINRPASPC